MPLKSATESARTAPRTSAGAARSGCSSATLMAGAHRGGGGAVAAAAGVGVTGTGAAAAGGAMPVARICTAKAVAS